MFPILLSNIIASQILLIPLERETRAVKTTNPAPLLPASLHLCPNLATSNLHNQILRAIWWRLRSCFRVSATITSSLERWLTRYYASITSLPAAGELGESGIIRNDGEKEVAYGSGGVLFSPGLSLGRRGNLRGMRTVIM